MTGNSKYFLLSLIHITTSYVRNPILPGKARLKAAITAMSLCLLLAGNSYSQNWIELKKMSDKAYKQFDVGLATAYLERANAAIHAEPAISQGQYDSLAVRLSELYTICMKFDKATPILKAILQNPAASQNSYEYIHALTNLGLNCLYREASDSAYLLFKKADSLVRISFNQQHFLYAENMLALSRWYNEVKMLDSALFCVTAAGKIYESVKTAYQPQFVLASSLAGNIYQQIGDVQTAKYYFNRASVEINSFFITYHPYVMESMIHLAEYAALLGRFSEAKAFYFTLTVSIPAKLGADNPLLINVYNNMGYLSVRANMVKDSFKPFTQALGLLEKHGMEQSIYYFTTKNNLGLAYLVDKQYSIADSILSVAAQMAKLTWGEHHYLYGTVLHNLGLLLASTGRLNEAANAIITAGKIYRAQLISDITGLSEREKLGLCYMAEVYFQILPSFAHLHKLFTDELVESSMFDEQSFLKGLISLNQQKIFTQIRNSNNSVLTHQLDDWSKNRTLLSNTYKNKTEKKTVDSLVREINLIERNMMSASRNFRQYQSELTVTAREIGNHLKKEEAAIEFIRYRLFTDTWTDSVFYSALVIEPGSAFPVFIDLCTEQQLKKILSPYYLKGDTLNALNELYMHPSLRKAGKMYASDSLYNLLWKPLEQYLQHKSTIYISAAGLLNLVSFAALPYHKQLLLDKYNIYRMQHLSSLVIPDTAKTVVNNILLWGGINYNLDDSFTSKNMPAKLRTHNATGCTRWKPLQYTLKEVTDIQDLFKKHGKNVTLYKDAKASRQSFSATDISQPAILHIATHGFYNKDTTEEVLNIPQAWSYNSIKRKEPLLRSGLVFAGANRYACPDSSLINSEGVMTSYDIASMNLEQVKLVTLSACETALGDIESGEGVFGLQRALKLAGVDKMILALWPVPDRQTAVFMNIFYKTLLSGSTIRDAFTKTQRKMSLTNTPGSWAGFILVE